MTLLTGHCNLETRLVLTKDKTCGFCHLEPETVRQFSVIVLPWQESDTEYLNRNSESWLPQISQEILDFTDSVGSTDDI